MRRAIARLKGENARMRARLARFEACADLAALQARGAFKLTALEARAFGLMVAHKRTYGAMLYTELYQGVAADKRPQRKIINVIVHKLRGKLRPHGVEIVSTAGFGWLLDDATRARFAGAGA